MLLEDSLRAVELVRGLDGPDRGRRLGRRRARDPARGRRCPSCEVTLLEASGGSASFLERLARRAAERCASSAGRAEEQATDAYGVAVAKALAPPPVAAEWCLPLVRPGRRVVLFVGPSADARARWLRVAERVGGGEPELRDGLLVVPKVGADAGGLPAPRREWRAGNVRSPELRPSGSRAWPGAVYVASRTRRAASARRRPRQPRRLPRGGRRARRSSSTSTRRRTRPRASASARTAPRRTTCSTARRSTSSPGRPGSRTSTSSRRSPISPAPRVELAAATTASATSPQALASGARRVRVRLPRLPAVARAADRERARRRRPRARAGAGRVLRARGARAARAVGRARPRAAQPAARARRRAPDDGRRAHAALRRRRRRGAAALRRARLRRRRPALGAARRGAEPRPARDRLRPPLGRRRGVLEGGDGACRAPPEGPARGAASAAASRC